MKQAPYTSYAPPRAYTYAHAHIDGASFYSALADAIDNAKDSIYMSFWHMNHKVIVVNVCVIVII